MIWDLVNLILTGIPDEFSFVKIFGVLFFLYIFVSIFKLFLDLIKDILRGI